ncbi:hypothetical protein KJ807_05630 [Patescibacteria group bacterium]|nr:hypothetical protein [Patescibacteria group bacterium]
MTELLENAYSMVGLDNVSPVFRGAITAGVITLAVSTIKPSFMYDDEGSPLPWSITAGKEEESALIPWWMPGVFGFVVGGLLI